MMRPPFVTEVRDTVVRLGNFEKISSDDYEILYFMLEQEISDNLSSYYGEELTDELKKELTDRLNEYLAGIPFKTSNLSVVFEDGKMKFDLLFDTDE